MVFNSTTSVLTFADMEGNNQRKNALRSDLVHIARLPKFCMSMCDAISDKFSGKSKLEFCLLELPRQLVNPGSRQILEF